MAAPQFEFRDTVATDTPRRFYSIHGKRIFDLALVILAAPVAITILVIVLFVTCLGGGNPLYAQSRIGRDDRIFRCWKVRTMVPDAEAALARILHADPMLADEWQRSQKLSRDPRVTRFGALLRKTSLDELPQLWNVLNGDMSIVGPRPFMPDQQRLYRAGRRDVDYYQMRPGITGLWQVSRRNQVSFAERAGYDEAYCENVSLGQDLRILTKTVGVVLRATGS